MPSNQQGQGRGILSIVPVVAPPTPAPIVYSAPGMGWRRSVDYSLYTRSRIVVPPSVSGAKSDSFTFNGSENPISRGGKLVNNGGSWTTLQEGGGVLFGSQDNSGGFDDSYAHLLGYGPNQRAWGRIAKGATSGTMEVEILLRVTDSAGSCKLYECNLAHDGVYAQIIRWKGPIGTSGADFEYLAFNAATAVPADDDVFMAEISGNIITSYLNGVVQATADITTTSGGPTAIYPTGNPGVATYRDHGAASTTYGFKTFNALELP